MRRYIIAFCSILTLGAVASCKQSAGNEEQAINKPEQNNSKNTNQTTLTGEQIKTIGIEFGTIEQKELANSIKANGILKVPNQNKAFVTPVFAGVVKSLNIEPGSFVRQGQTIATIYNPDLLQLQQQVQQLSIEIGLSEKEVDRQKELVEGNAAPLKKLQQAQTELATLKSRRDGLKRQLSGMGASQTYSSNVAVKAPIAGTISKINAQIGSSVDLNTPIAEIVNNSQLHLDLFVYERDLPKIKIEQIIHFTITNNPEKEYDATVFSVGNAFETGTKTVPVHATIKGNKSGLIDGMNITGLISLDVSTFPAVPTTAIITDGGKDYIFMVINKTGDVTTFERVPVVKGTTDVGYSAITLLKEIPSTAKIVTKGAFFIQAKMTNTGEHEH